MAVTLNDLYQQVLGRAPDPSGREFYTREFGPTIEPSEIDRFLAGVAGFDVNQVNTQAAEALKQRAAQGGEGLLSTGDIENLYQTYLGRSADPAGLDFYRREFASDGNISQDEINRFLAGARAAGETIRTGGETTDGGTTGGTTQPGFTEQDVRNLYQQYFLRDPDQEGLKFWMNQFKGGATPGIDPEEIAAFRAGAKGQDAPGATAGLAANAGESRIDPTIAPYLSEALGRARQLFLQGQAPQLYPEQMYVSPSQQTLTALSRAEQLANRAPILEEGQTAFQKAMGEATKVAAGEYVKESPYLQAQLSAALRPLQKQFTEQVIPGISSQFSQAGRYGSGAMERATSGATEAFTRAAGDITSNIAGQQFQQERAYQQAAIPQLAQFGAMAPQFYQTQFMPIQQLAQVGAQREAIAAQPLQESMQRFQYQQQLPYQQLSGYLSSIYGSPLGRLTGAPEQQSNSFLQNAGAAINIAGTAAKLFPDTTNRVYNWFTGTFG
jgi:hypothetical protein